MDYIGAQRNLGTSRERSCCDHLNGRWGGQDLGMGIPRSHGGGGWTDGSGRHGHVEVALSEGTREADRLVKVEGARQRVSGQHTRGTGGAGT